MSATAQPESVSAPAARRLAAVARMRDASVVIAVVALFAALSIGSDAFLTKTNLLNVADQAVTLGIVAAAVTIVVIAGGFDLSVAAIFAVAGIVAAELSVDAGIFIAALAGVAVGGALGALNGALVTVGRVNSFLATLGSATVIAGVATVVTGGYIATTSESFTALGRDSFLGVKYTVLVLVAVAAACWVLLARTAFGRAVYAVGANAAVARLSGLRVDAVRAATFFLSGVAAGIAGVLAASHAGQAQVGVGSGLELTAIAAVAIGGTSILGGRGAIWRTVLGVLLLTLINNGLNLLGVDPAFQQVARGAIILAALGLDALARRA